MKTENTQTKRKKVMSAIISVCAFFASYFLIQQLFFKPNLDKQLAKVASEINKTCPMQVDEYTVLNNVVSLPNKTLQYNYTLPDYTKAEANIDTMKKYVFPDILIRVKNSPDLKYYRDSNVTLNYNYSDKEGIFVYKYVVTPKMYK
jgi:hypothetical protein